MLGLAQILVAVPENASQSTVDLLRKKAHVILGKLRGGADFASVAAAVSDGPQALNGGHLGVRPTNGCPDLFIDAAAKLKPGQITDIIQSGNGFHILKIVSRTEPQGERNGGQPPAGAAQADRRQEEAQIDQGPKMVTRTNARQIGRASWRERVGQYV